jgi:hypothetical protein
VRNLLRERVDRGRGQLQDTPVPGGRIPTRIACASRASAKGKTSPTFVVRWPASSRSAMVVRPAVVTVTSKNTPRTRCRAALSWSGLVTADTNTPQA